MAAHNESILHSNNSTRRLFDSIRDDEDVIFLQGLLQEGADIDARDSEGYTPLLLACLQNRDDIADLLIVSGANVVVKCNDAEYTVLHFASQNGWINIIQTIVTKVPDLNARDIRGNTALHVASLCGHLEIVKILLEKGADVNTQDSDDGTALHNASFRGNLEIVKCLVEKLVDINIQDCTGSTALHHASCEGHLETVKFLLEKGADVNTMNNNGDAALHIASYRGHLEIVMCLVEQGTDVNIKDSDSATALHTASFQGHLKIVACLVEKGADINTLDSNGDAALHIASSRGYLEIVECLVEKGADINIQDSNGKSALHLASYEGHLETVKCLVERGCQKGLNLDARGISGYTALGCACINEHLGIVQYLLEAGASWDIVDKDGQSLLTFFALDETPMIEFIKLFIVNGAYLKRVDYEAIVKSSSLEVLQDVKLCCQSIVNKYNNHDVPELYKLPVSKILPRIEKMKIASNSEVTRAIERSVGFEIQTKGHCNVLDVHHMGLSVFSVGSVLEYYGKMASELQNGLKRSAAFCSNDDYQPSNKVMRLS